MKEKCAYIYVYIYVYIFSHFCFSGEPSQWCNDVQKSKYLCVAGGKVKHCSYWENSIEPPPPPKKFTTELPSDSAIPLLVYIQKR